MRHAKKALLNVVGSVFAQIFRSTGHNRAITVEMIFEDGSLWLRQLQLGFACR